jgi:hypothetical protein
MLEHFQEYMSLIEVTPVTKAKQAMREVHTDGTPYSISAAVFRLSGRDVKNAPEGQYTTEDIKIYLEPDAAKPVAKGFKINVNDGETYIAQAPKPREEGNFVIVMCKKVVV